MLRNILIIIGATIFGMSACATPQEKLSSEVSDFIQLLLKVEEPTLAEYAKFSGECGGESELAFVVNECRSKGWESNSSSCINFSGLRCQSSKQEPSLELGWLRKNFSTVERGYKLISIQSESEDVDLIKVKIGRNEFLLFHNKTPYPPGGVIVDVSEVNGKKIADYLKEGIK